LHKKLTLTKEIRLHGKGCNNVSLYYMKTVLHPKCLIVFTFVEGSVDYNFNDNLPIYCFYFCRGFSRLQL